jgi:hypothetical protein
METQTAEVRIELIFLDWTEGFRKAWNIDSHIKPDRNQGLGLQANKLLLQYDDGHSVEFLRMAIREINQGM